MEHTTIILEKLCSRVFEEHAPVYFILDRLGQVREWGGCFGELGIKEPEKLCPITDIILFMEGILPLKGQSMEFSCIKMGARPSMDALLFQVPDGYGLIIWDTSEKESLLTETQQKFNELSLLIEKQKILLDPESSAIEQRNEKFLKELFMVLNFAVLEMDHNGHFVLMGTPPPWIEQIPQAARMLAGQHYEEDVFSFLGNFIQDVKSRWARGHQGTFKSGIWIVKDHSDQELLFEATAADLHGRKLLIISHDVCHPHETQSLIQKGRDLALNYHSLKQSGKKLKIRHDEMEMRVRERTKDLEAANLKLANELVERKKAQEERDKVALQLRQSQKMEAIGTLAGGIAHDFNNILSAIMGFTELSIAEADTGSNLHTRLEKILKASNRARTLIQQILTFSRQSDYEKNPLRLRAIVTEVLDLISASLPAFIEIERHLDSDAHILADKTQIHQVIMNLCTNAWQAMKNAPGKLIVILKEIEIKQGDPVPSPEMTYGRYLKLSVRDTGSGMTPEIQERIFDPYFTTKSQDKGTGLGLSVVHGIVTRNKGAICVNSRVGHGSTFCIYLPVFDVSAEDQPAAKKIQKGRGEHLLLVDDEPYQTEMAKEMLEMLGYEVQAFNDSEAALDLFLNDPDRFDLVITDMVMPKMSGKILAGKMLECRPDIPIILLSGYSDDLDPEQITETGVSQYLMKPVAMEELAHAVQTALGS